MALRIEPICAGCGLRMTEAQEVVATLARDDHGAYAGSDAAVYHADCFTPEDGSGEVVVLRGHPILD